MGSKCIVILDNLSVHKVRVVKEYYIEAFSFQYLLPYSSTFNPIERVWN